MATVKVPLSDIMEIRTECPIHPGTYEVFHATPIDDEARAKEAGHKGLWFVEYECGFNAVEDARDV